MVAIVPRWDKYRRGGRLPGAVSDRIRVLIYSFLYIIAVHFAYVEYINPQFEYAHYSYLNFSFPALTTTYLLAYLPCLAYKSSQHPAQAVSSLLFVLTYIPIQLTLLFTVDQPYSEIVVAQGTLALSMMVIFAAARSYRERGSSQVANFHGIDIVMGAFTIAAMALLVYLNAAHMRFVSFEDVYDLRLEAAAVGNDIISAYLISWLSYCFVSYFYARAIVGRKHLYIILGLGASLIIYTATGSKAAILLLPMTYFINRLWVDGGGFLVRLLLTMAVLIMGLVLFIPDSGIGLWVKSIGLVRVVGTTGWVAAKYYEYFGQVGYTYYNHIGPVNIIFGGYPFGDLALGQLIGIEYADSKDANFNGGFWASDGFAALGVAGIVVITPAVVLVMYLLNRAMIALSSAFAVTWLVGFSVALLNLPLSTALLSGGGLLTMLLASQLPRQIKRFSPANDVFKNRHQI